MGAAKRRPGAGAYADAYFGLLADLEALLGRPTSAVRNPFLRETIEHTRIPLHAA